jgi:Uncharacterised protein family (UPF0261)
MATGPVAVMAPLQGFDSYQQRPDGPWIDPETDASFYTALRNTLDSRIALIELEANINDKAFADAVAQRFCALWAESLAGTGDRGMGDGRPWHGLGTAPQLISMTARHARRSHTASCGQRVCRPALVNKVSAILQGPPTFQRD